MLSDHAVGLQQTVRATFGNTVQGAFGTAFSDTESRGTFGTAFSNAEARGAFSAAFGDTEARGTFGAAFSNAEARGTFGATFGDTEARGAFSAAFSDTEARGTFSAAFSDTEARSTFGATFGNTVQGALCTALGDAVDDHVGAFAFSDQRIGNSGLDDRDGEQAGEEQGGEGLGFHVGISWVVGGSKWLRGPCYGRPGD